MKYLKVIRGEIHLKSMTVVFRGNFCLRKETVISELNLIDDRIESLMRRGNSITSTSLLLTAVCLNATEGFQEVIGEVSDIHKSTAFRIIHQVSVWAGGCIL